MKFKRPKLTGRGLLLLTIVMVMLPLVLLGTFSANLFVSREKARVQNELDIYAQTISSDFENSLNSIKSYYLSLVTRSNFLWLKTQRQPPYSQVVQLHEIQRLLEGDYHIYPYIEEYTFLNIKAGWVLNNYGLFPLSEASNAETVSAFIDAQTDNMLPVSWVQLTPTHGVESGTSAASSGADSSGEKMLNAEGEELLPSGRKKLRDSHYVNLKGEQLLIKAGTVSSQPGYILLVKLKTEAFESFLRPFSRKYSVEVLSRSGERLVGNSEGLYDFLKNRIYGAETGDVKNLSLPQHFAHRGHRYQGISRLDGLSGFNYYIAYDLSDNWKNYIYFVLFSLLIGAMTLGMLCLLRLSYHKYTEFVSGLEHKLSDQQLSMKKLFLERILSGKADEAYVERQLAALNMKGSGFYRLSTFMTRQADAAETGQELRLPDAGEMCAYFADLLPDYAILPLADHERMVIVTQGVDAIQLDADTAELYKFLRDEAMSRWGVRLMVGISGIYTELNDTNNAFKEALEALLSQQRQAEPQGSAAPSMVLFEDYMKQGQDRNFAFDLAIENELKNTVRRANEEEVGQFVSLLMRRMEQKELKGREREFYLMRIVLAVLEVPLNADISLNAVFPDNRANIMQRVLQIYDYKKLENFLKQELLQPVMRSVAANRFAGDSELVRSMIQMIHDREGDITLNECAAALHYHASYLWRVLKKEKDCTFTDLVNQVKLDRGKQLLLTSQVPIAEIAERLHYHNVQNFIRFFSKMEGITPAKYRKEHLK